MDEVQKILLKYPGKTIEFALSFDVEGYTLLGHLLSHIESKKKESFNDGGKSALEEVRTILWRVNKKSDRELIMKHFDQVSKKYGA